MRRLATGLGTGLLVGLLVGLGVGVLAGRGVGSGRGQQAPPSTEQRGAAAEVVRACGPERWSCVT